MTPEQYIDYYPDMHPVYMQEYDCMNCGMTFRSSEAQEVCSDCIQSEKRYQEVLKKLQAQE